MCQGFLPLCSVRFLQTMFLEKRVLLKKKMFRGDQALGRAHRSGASDSSTLRVVLLESWVSVPDIFLFLPSAPG